MAAGIASQYLFEQDPEYLGHIEPVYPVPSMIVKGDEKEKRKGMAMVE